MDLKNFISPTLTEAPAYKLQQTGATIKLDQNESPYDWPEELKKKTLEKLSSTLWQRYPEPFDDELTAKLASYVGVDPDNIVTGAGSNYLITVLMNFLCRHLKGKTIIARPSFPLYEMHCRYENIPYEIWPQKDFSYNIHDLPIIPDHSVIIFASPNNPAGNILAKKDLEDLLVKHPSCFIIADEAYFEFQQDSFIELTHKYKNLILIRTLSKTLSSAAIRFGYIVCNAEVKAQLIKTRLPFILNSFSLTAINTLLDSPEALSLMIQRAAEIAASRDQVYQEIIKLSQNYPIQSFPSYANFVLLKFADNLQKSLAHEHLVAHNIIVRDVSKGKGLEGCLRAGIGSAADNKSLLKTLENFLKKNPPK